MEFEAGRIERIAIGRNTIVVHGRVAASLVAGAIVLRINGQDADAFVQPPVIAGNAAIAFAAEAQRDQIPNIKAVSIGLPDGTELTAGAGCSITKLAPSGYIDRADAAGVSGWLYDPDLGLNEMACIEVAGLGRFSFVPTIERQDVVAAGLAASPLVGFAVSTLPPVGSKRPALTGSAEVRLISRGIVVAVASCRRHRSLSGHLSVTANGALRGWLADTLGGHHAIEADLEVDGEPTMRITASAAAAGDAVPPGARAVEVWPALAPANGAVMQLRLVDPCDGSLIGGTAVALAGATAEVPNPSRRIDVQGATSRPRMSRPRILSVLAATGGGTPQTNLDLMRGIERDFEPYVLAAGPGHLQLSRIENGRPTLLASLGLTTRVDAVTHDSHAYRTAFRDILAQEMIDLVHVRHLAWHGTSLITCAKALSIPVVVSFHDFYAVCPTVKLLDERGRHCAGRCTAGRGPCVPELWPAHELPPLKHAFVHQWRQTQAEVLARADHFVTTSEHARSLILENLPALSARPFDVIAHGRDFDAFAHAATVPAPGERLRIVAPGNLSPAKGAHIVAALASDPRFELHVIGEMAAFLAASPVIAHGAYARDELTSRIAAIRPHVGLVASIWPETYCHTLTELWAAGVPVLAFDTGAVGERLRESGGGWLADGTSAANMLTRLVELSSNPAMIGQAIAEVGSLQASRLAVETVAWMSERYAALYRQLIG